MPAQAGSVFARAARPKKTWIPASAGMTEGRLDFRSTISEPQGFETGGVV